MTASWRRSGLLLTWLCLTTFAAQLSHAQTPTTWWPDPTTGLMWTGQASAGAKGRGLTWQEANDYCSTLHLGGYTGWRLPKLEEVKAVSYSHRVDPEDVPLSHDMDKRVAWVDLLEFKGGISISEVWTSSIYDQQSAWTASQYFILSFGDPHFRTAPLNSRRGNGNYIAAVCVESIDANLLQIAKDAQVKVPVPDELTLKAYVPLAKAQLAYQSGQYQESIAQGKNALLIKSDFANAYWAIGISEGRLGQWDLAVTNLEAALKIDKNYGDAKDGLKWAKDGLKAAKDGKAPQTQSPQWN